MDEFLGEFLGAILEFIVGSATDKTNKKRTRLFAIVVLVVLVIGFSSIFFVIAYQAYDENKLGGIFAGLTGIGILIISLYVFFVRTKSNNDRNHSEKAIYCIENIYIKEVPVVIYGHPSDMVYIYIHGPNGRKEDAKKHTKEADDEGRQILSIDLPKHGERRRAKEELNGSVIKYELETVLEYARKHWKHVSFFSKNEEIWREFSEEIYKQLIEIWDKAFWF